MTELLLPGSRETSGQMKTLLGLYTNLERIEDRMIRSSRAYTHLPRMETARKIKHSIASALTSQLLFEELESLDFTLVGQFKNDQFGEQERVLYSYISYLADRTIVEGQDTNGNCTRIRETHLSPDIFLQETIIEGAPSFRLIGKGIQVDLHR